MCHAEGMGDGEVSWAELAAAYRLALLEAGYKGTDLPPSSAARRAVSAWTTSSEAFERFANMKTAALVMSLIDHFAEQSGLRSNDDFSVSCLPASSEAPKGICRASAVSLGMVEVFVVWLDRDSGEVAWVDIWAERDEDLTEFYRVGLNVAASKLDIGGWQIELPGEIAFDLLSDPVVESVVTNRVSALRLRKRRGRREDWHNSWLWNAIEFGVVDPSAVVSDEVRVTDVTAPDVLRTVRQRTSQQKFRSLLLENFPNECAICGIDVVEVLEAAHLVAHAEGGAASLNNGRLLCANHHRAFDAGLYVWTGSTFRWVRDELEPEQLAGRGDKTRK